MIVNILQILGIYACLIVNTIALTIVLSTTKKEDKDA
jgi:hypothetical protein